MPQRQQVTWAKLRVGVMVLVSLIVLAVGIFFISGQVGFFSRRYALKTYFSSAGGVREGSEVRLAGIPVGNVKKIGVSPFTDPQRAVEIDLRISRHYQDQTLAFDERQVLLDVSFQVHRGETLFLLGVAASGKSIILKLALGLLKPDSGGILVEGQDIAPLPENRLGPFRRRMGIVFQEGALFDSLSVYENVAYRLREEGLEGEAAIERRVREVLGFVEMEQAIDKMPSELSGGMRRRVAIARAIVGDPAIMLYDSPTAGLDPVTAHTINVLMAKLRDVGQVSSIAVTHRLQDAFILANFIYSSEKQDLVPAQTDGGAGRAAPTRFLVLREGGVYFQGAAAELVAAPDPYLRRFLA